MANVFTKAGVSATLPSSNQSNDRLVAPGYPAAGDIWVTDITKAQCKNRVVELFPITSNATHLNNYGKVVFDSAGAISALPSGSGFVAVAAMSTANKCNMGFTTINGVEYLSVALLGTQYNAVAATAGSLVLKFVA
jgi:hypothetical protein